jgi:hypothetical protein
MPKLHRWAKCAATAASFLILASPAHASLESSFLDQDVYLTSESFFLPLDYTVPSDGLTRQWDFGIESADPDATLTLSAPNQVFTILWKVGPGGVIGSQLGPDPDYVFSQLYSGPGLVSYLVSAQKSFNFCDSPGPVGSTCGADYFVWGNAAPMLIQSDAPVTIHLTSTVVPEPTTWALMILGFGGAGAMLRRRRRLAA